MYQVVWRDNDVFLVWWTDRTQTQIRITRHRVANTLVDTVRHVTSDVKRVLRQCGRRNTNTRPAFTNKGVFTQAGQRQIF